MTENEQKMLNRIAELEAALRDIAEDFMDYSPLTGNSFHTHKSLRILDILEKGNIK